MTMYTDKAECPKGHRFNVRRHMSNAGLAIMTKCPACDNKQYEMYAGPIPLRAIKSQQARPTLERQIEARLVKRVADLGGEVRKVAWIGRRGAPDRLVMRPSAFGHLATIWVELKAPGKAAKFPTGAHEKAQHREHERMRKMGQRVEVIDSYEQIEELLK
jgi:hypothetical protein